MSVRGDPVVMSPRLRNVHISFPEESVQKTMPRQPSSWLSGPRTDAEAWEISTEFGGATGRGGGGGVPGGSGGASGLLGKAGGAGGGCVLAQSSQQSV